MTYASFNPVAVLESQLPVLDVSREMFLERIIPETLYLPRDEHKPPLSL